MVTCDTVRNRNSRKNSNLANVGKDDGHDARADDSGKLALGGRQHEYPVRSLHEPARECDALLFVAVEQRVGRIARNRLLQLPCEIDGVADASVHALPTSGAVDVRRVAEQECAAFAEMLRDS